MLLNKFFSALVAKIWPDKVVRWCPDGDFWRLFWVLHLQRGACGTFQTCILNSHYGHTMCGSMADIQSAVAEIRRGKKEEERKKKKERRTRMWANAQRDGRLAKHRWRPLFNAVNFG